jgi:hypothetical protein
MLVVEASRKVLYGLRTVTSRVTRNLEVRLDPPRVAVSRSITSSISAAPNSWC